MHAVLCAAGQNLRPLLRAAAVFLSLGLRVVLARSKSFRFCCMIERPITMQCPLGHALAERSPR